MNPLIVTMRQIAKAAPDAMVAAPGMARPAALLLLTVLCAKLPRFVTPLPPRVGLSETSPPAGARVSQSGKLYNVVHRPTIWVPDGVLDHLLARETALARPNMPLLDRFSAPSFPGLFSCFRARPLQNHRLS